MNCKYWMKSSLWGCDAGNLSILQLRDSFTNFHESSAVGAFEIKRALKNVHFSTSSDVLNCSFFRSSFVIRKSNKKERIVYISTSSACIKCIWTQSETENILNRLLSYQTTNKHSQVRDTPSERNCCCKSLKLIIKFAFGWLRAFFEISVAILTCGVVTS